MVRVPYRDREEAGRVLAAKLQFLHARPDAIVLALPRGGVPLGHAIARALGVALDLMLVRKLGVPGHEELAAGAIAMGGVEVLNDEVVQGCGLRRDDLDTIARRERAELDRRARAYRGARPMPLLTGRCVVLVDDGFATGATMSAAVRACRAQGALRVVVAVPVAPPDAVARLRGEADQVICPVIPFDFAAIGQYYDDFHQVSDEEVRALLGELWDDSTGPASTSPGPGPAT